MTSNQKSSDGPVPPGRHDPEGRRRQIIEATTQLVSEVGTSKITHRLVAQRAGVSLGTTTRYFDSLEELIGFALRELAQRFDRELEEVRTFLNEHGCTAETLSRYLYSYLSNTETVRIDAEFFIVAVSDPKLKTLNDRWNDGLVSILSEHIGIDAARGAVLLLDGATISAAVNGEPLDEPLLRRFIAALLTISASEEHE